MKTMSYNNSVMSQKKLSTVSYLILELQNNYRTDMPICRRNIFVTLHTAYTPLMPFFCHICNLGAVGRGYQFNYIYMCIVYKRMNTGHGTRLTASTFLR